MPDPTLLSPAQAGRTLGVSRSTLWRWEKDGKLTPAFVTPGGHRRYRLSDIEALLTPRKV